MNELKITIDNDVLDKYYKEYFKRYPKRKKRTIETPHHPSINKWMIMRRIAMNDLKGKWKEFIIWFVENQGLKDFKLEKCTMTFISYFKTKIRKDVDNTVPKFILDGMVEGGLLIDDDSKYLESLTLQCGYDKEYPRTDIFIYY